MGNMNAYTQWVYVDEKEFVCLLHTLFAKPMHDHSLASSTLCTCKPFIRTSEVCFSSLFHCMVRLCPTSIPQRALRETAC